MMRASVSIRTAVVRSLSCGASAIGPPRIPYLSEIIKKTDAAKIIAFVQAVCQARNRKAVKQLI